jgi:hypothetical protein
MHWTLCSVLLPLPRSRVIVYVPKSVMNGEPYTGGAYFECPGRWWIGEGLINEPSHWMAFPRAPDVDSV